LVAQHTKESLIHTSKNIKKKRNLFALIKMENEEKVINFYALTEDWGEFSNFYRAAILIDGKEWSTTEHYFQAMKFAGTEVEEVIRKVAKPGDAKRIGRKHEMKRKDWAEVKDGIMLFCCREKFRQHPALMEKLLSTGDAKLVEHTKNDSYWGDGGDGTGRNQLGKTLMTIRDEFRKELDAGATTS
jgi:ribA/ribD-fused uncharacterized protein